MKEYYGNIWDFQALRNVFICVLVNESIMDDKLVMGAGQAKEAKEFYPALPMEMARDIKNYGRLSADGAYYQTSPQKHKHWKSPSTHRTFDCIVAFPTKYNYWEASSLELIERSCKELYSYMCRYPDETFYLPRPGCGLGQRSWDDEIKPLLTQYFQEKNNLIVCHK